MHVPLLRQREDMHTWISEGGKQRGSVTQAVAVYEMCHAIAFEIPQACHVAK